MADAKLEQEARDVFGHLAHWIETEGDKGPTIELLEWLRDQDAAETHEPDPNVQADYYYISAGNSIIYFAHVWQFVEYAFDDDRPARTYVLERYDLAHRHEAKASG